MNQLLTRDDFRRLVFERDGHKCVVCKKEATAAHHIIERRLFDDEGYYASNGASLCDQCHILAEQTVLTCEQIRKAAGINDIKLPENLYGDYACDKWGNSILPNGMRVKGELFFDESVQKILEAGGVLKEFSEFVKYPRTYHCPWSLGITKDDRVHKEMSGFEKREIVVTEKVDGEGFSLYSDGLHARSIDSRNHPSRNWLKNFHVRIKNDIPKGWRICGENLYASHSISYSSLPSYFLAFAIFDEKSHCLSWNSFTEWCELLGLKTPTILYKGVYDQVAIKSCWTGRSSFGGQQEGYVGRLAESFPFQSFKQSVFKFVRSGHVGTSNHWMYEKMYKNGLKA